MRVAVLERIRMFCTINNYSVKKLASLMDMGQVTVNNYLNGNRKVSYEFIVSFINTFKINANWLINGEGNMFNDDVSLLAAPEVETKPRIPYSASAGALSNALDGVFLHQCERIPIISAFPKYDFTIQVKGESMQGLN